MRSWRHGASNHYRANLDPRNAPTSGRAFSNNPPPSCYAALAAGPEGLAEDGLYFLAVDFLRLAAVLFDLALALAFTGLPTAATDG